MRDRNTSRRLAASLGLRFFAAVCALIMLLAGSAKADWLPATGDGVDLWIVRPSADPDPGIKILHRRDLEEPINRIFRVTTLSGRLAPGTPGGLASAGERLWIVYDNLNVQSLPVTLSDNVAHERYGEPRPAPALPSPAKLWSITANQDGPWVLLRLDSEKALAALQNPPDASQPSPTTAPAPTPTTLPATAPTVETVVPVVSAEAEPAPTTQPFKPIDVLVRLKRNRWIIESLPEDWLPEARNFVLMLDTTSADPVLVSLRPDLEGSPTGTTAVVYHKTATGWTSRSYSLPNTGDHPAAGNEPIPLAINQQLVIASLTFTPTSPTSPAVPATTQAAATTAPATAAPGKGPTGTLTLNMAILGNTVSSITPLVLSQNKPAAYAMVPVRWSLAVIFADDDGTLSWGVVDLHGKLEGIFTNLNPHNEQDLSEQTVWLVPVLLIAAAVLIMFSRMRKDSPAAVPKFPQGFVVADFLRRGLAFFLDLAPCVIFTTTYFGIEAPVLIGKWLYFNNVGWDVMLPRLIVVGLFALHTGITEAFTGKSFGKMILGLKVVSTDGNPPTLGQIVVRNVLKIFDLIAWPLLFLPIMRPYAQRLGDLAAKTVVVMPEPTEDEDEDGPDDSM